MSNDDDDDDDDLVTINAPVPRDRKMKLNWGVREKVAGGLVLGVTGGSVDGGLHANKNVLLLDTTPPERFLTQARLYAVAEGEPPIHEQALETHGVRILNPGVVAQAPITDEAWASIVEDAKKAGMEPEAYVASRLVEDAAPFPVWPDLSRTEAAIKAFDASDEHWMDNGPLGRAVGEAFGLDTIDRNNPEDCAHLIRPGPPEPPLGDRDVSFVRRCVRAWRQEVGGC
jgi:hypothetical protein